MKNNLSKSLLLLASASVLFATSIHAQDAKSTVPLALDLPLHTLKGTPEDLPGGPNIEPLSDVAPTPVQVPKGVKNVAAGITATSSVAPFLGESFAIHAIAMWHDHRYVQAMHDVILQVSDDPEFKSGVTTLYNNDTDNSSGLGVGTDREYFELQFGRVVAAKGIKARYVRGFTRGSNQSSLNCWQEIEVYALPAK